MKRYIIWIPLLIFLISCGKHDVRHYAGVVVDTTGAPVPQATVSIIYRQGASSFQDGGDAIHTLAVTDLNGTFSSKFTLRKKEYIEHFTFSSPPPNSKSLQTYEYNTASNTNIRFVIK